MAIQQTSDTVILRVLRPEAGNSFPTVCSVTENDLINFDYSKCVWFANWNSVIGAWDILGLYTLPYRA